MRNIIALTLSCSLSILAPMAQTSDGRARVKSATNQVAVQFQFKEPVVTLNEPVVLLFSVHNGLSQPVTLTLGARKTQFFRFSLRTPEGRTLQDSRNPGDNVSVVIFGPVKTMVEPGANYQQPILMNEWFRFGTVGTYLLTSQLTAGIETSEGKPLPQEGQTATRN